MLNNNHGSKWNMWLGCFIPCWNGKEQLEERCKGFDMLKMHSIYMSENFKKQF